MIQVNRIYLIFNRLVTKKFLVDTSDVAYKKKQMRLTFNPACQSERQTPSESVY